jgi:dolichyl-phosphate beta-glucosyltransferase
MANVESAESERMAEGIASPATTHNSGEIGAKDADHDLTVIIPAYNEEARLPWTLAELAKYLDAWQVDYRVLVANDGSSDRTASLTDGLGSRFSTLTLSPQGGKGRAVRAAMLQAAGRIVAFTDADLPFDLAALRAGYEWINAGTCDVVFGARDIPGASRVVTRKITRHIATHAFRALMQVLISREITDTQCGLKVFRRLAARDIFSRTTIDGFAFDAEVVLLAHRLGLPFRRVPVTLVNDYGSALSLRRHTLPMIADVLKLWWRTPRNRVLAENKVAAVDAVQHEGTVL